MVDQEYESMADVIKEYINERRDKKEVALLKDKPKKHVGGINFKLEEIIKKNANNQKELEKISKKKSQSVLQFQQEKMQGLISLAGDLNIDIQSIKDEYEKSVSKINSEHDVLNWLSANCKNAFGVSFATHVIKLTHTRIKGASNIFDTLKSKKEQYLSTSTIQNIQLDSAFDNAAYASVATLLQLKHQDKTGGYKTLSQYVIKDDTSPFEAFTDDREKIKKWMVELKKAFGAERKSSHFLAKQVYYPLADSNGYHMLLPIVSSSMAHELYLRFSKVFDNGSKEAREQKKANLYTSDIVVYYPDKANIKVTARNPINASKLNSIRGGKLSLLSCSPPQRQQKLKPPINKPSLFYTELDYQSREPVRKLQKLLMAIKINERSKNDPKIHQRIMEFVDEIIAIVFNYVQSIQSLKNEAGWSEDSALKEAHQFWLDPYRDDEAFQKKRKQNEWHKEIEEDFSLWLNKQLEHKKMILGKQLQRLWKDLFIPRFKVFNAVSEVTL